ncbi:MAG: hypothetical protein A2745_00440 [Candidatus Harrisonbacteria bacterium RIFCSPHIGHO2_01_FULL_44_13]|uniref:D-alanine--D-alanine ligase n=1 Tax=Candidatus Harrisonbacteria bacterium RIFCSPLOWO2_01_FULL_44_18 TaxID=1798407 RepID=A0A1G1ZPQ0_9BACT|nr:MAG: hypothetical protein A2745_00440 [Candidatus Harrisonbacteria bacterium RIFCSPHIGHO2_01_FULL_44_13]OGY66136.1 MAG: hypothetical protein A3A16_02380 [Candidatus Harrisonbacteria bacterium RIFCSPLOWO2_01_FULL_44_18]
MNKDRKIKIAVLMGGPSAEHNVSLATGKMILGALDKSKYFAKGIVISRNGRWPISPEKVKKEYDVAFIAMHGAYGEDGQIQSLLEKLQIPYTGSNSLSSWLGMNKPASLELFKKSGLAVPKFVTLRKEEIGLCRLNKLAVSLPLVIKPANHGSSVGVSIVKNKNRFLPALLSAGQYSGRIMIQKYILGREVTCGAIEKNGKLVALPPTEIIPKSGEFFDYKSKYLPGGSQEITPARLPKNLTKKIQDIAKKTHRLIGASGMSRTDMIVEKLKIYVLEINTIPGMTKTSLLPQAAKAAGISFPQMLDLIIESALKKVTSY